MHHRRDRRRDGRFPTAAHLASWAGTCPGNNITGGKRRSGKTTKGDVWLGEILIECAWAAARAQNTYLAAQFWRLARRIGKKRAAVAVGHSILVIAWHLFSNDCAYEDLGGDYFVKPRHRSGTPARYRPTRSARLQSEPRPRRRLTAQRHQPKTPAIAQPSPRPLPIYSLFRVYKTTKSDPSVPPVAGPPELRPRASSRGSLIAP